MAATNNLWNDDVLDDELESDDDVELDDEIESDDDVELDDELESDDDVELDDELDSELDSDLKRHRQNLDKTQFEAVEAIAKVAEITEKNNLLRQNFKTTRDLCYEKINLIQSLFEEGAIKGDSAEISSFKELLREMKIDLDSRSRNLERLALKKS
uniref:Uncharacterized protein n=1 Tax=Fagus sylvatica TaxID=28930 RepID=A0A2N9E8Y3_FAGSY